MSESDGGIRIEDKRALRDEEPRRGGQEQYDDCKSEERRAGRTPLPEMDFGTFVLSLASSALMHLGQMENPETGKKERNLPLAKQTIDILGVLQEKTKGNLTQEEDRLLTELLYDLRLKYVAVCHESKD